tara:strand:- start:162 stop:575 length:414 start_codon:yes stop_codon:yes gene_type:complete
MVTKTGYWIQVVDGQVKEVWDTTPPSNQEGWREAVEVFPDLVANREMFTTHSFDLEATPAQIVWAKRELTVGERKGSLVASANADFEIVVRRELAKEIDNYPTTQYDASAVATAQAIYESRIDVINAAETHDDVDGL